MSVEHPTEGEVAGAAVRLYNIAINYAIDHPDTPLGQRLYNIAINYAIDHPDTPLGQERDYWDPEIWDIAERLIVLVGEKVLP